MDHRVVYECTLCGAATPALVTDLVELRALVPERDQKFLCDQDDSDFLATRAAEALVFATCPHCSERNPAGVAEQAADRRRTRLIGSLASLATVIAIWFVPWLAFVVAALVVVMAGLGLVSRFRAKVLRWYEVAANVAIAALVIAVAWFYPRAGALFPLVLGVRFALWRGDDAAWTQANEKIRFEMT